jgi:hypothetical protein
MTDSPKVSDVVKDALDCFQTWSAVEAKQRERELDDLKFQVPELQWPDAVQQQRAAQRIDGVTLPARPMLSIPKLDQPIQLVLNQEKAAHLGVQVHPLTEDADDDTAEILQGLYRAIEVDSRAGLARSWAFERAVKAGRGFYRILTEYDDTSDHPSDQKIVIRRIYEQGSVYLDPAASEPDGSDAERALIVEDMPVRKYKRLFPKSKLASYSDEEFVALGNERPGWVTGEGDGRAVRVAEWFYVTYETETVKWEGGSREREKRVVHWCKLNAAEELETTVCDGRYIPIVRVARELIPFDGEKRMVGMIGPNKDAQRLFNYAATGSVEMAALETKASHALDPKQIEGYETWWQQKNTRNFPYLPFSRMVNGQDYGPPVPIQADMSKMQVNALLLQQAGEFIHAGTSTFEPSLGNQSPNVKTKGATLALQSQSEQATSHWLDNLAEISLTYEGRVVLDLIPYVYDRPGRIARILDLEDQPKQVLLNAPFTMQGKKPVPYQAGQMRGQTPMAAMRGPMGPPQGPQTPPGDVKHYDLTKGRYGVTVTIGKAYKSRVEQGKDELAQVFQAAPELFPILGDIYLKFADFPGHREASERMKRGLPQQFRDPGEQDPQMELQQAKAALQQQGQQMQEMAKALETDKVKVDGQIQQEQIRASMQLTLQKMKDATSVAVAQIQILAKGVQMQTEARNEAQAVGDQQLVDAHTAAMDRQHEINTVMLKHQQAMDAAQQAHEHAMAQGQAGAQQDAALADQGHQQALEQGDQSAQHTMAAQQQAADLAPQPEAGA